MKRWSVTAFVLVLGMGLGTAVNHSWLHGQNPPPIQAPAHLPRELTSYRDVVKRVLPAVVSIETRAKPKPVAARVNPDTFDDSRVPEDFRRFFEEFRRAPSAPSVPREPGALGFGSGFFVDPAGVIVTNYHVVDGADSVTVNLHDGRKFTTKNVKVDRRTDLAVVVLDVKDGKFPYLELGDSEAMEIGDRVLAVGAPFGLAGSVTHGIVSAKGRNGLHMNMYEDFLQTDAPINPGNSGGPLVNLEGKVVGINAAIKSRSGGFQGVGLAVASNLAKNVIHSLRTTGTVQRGYLGVQVRELDPDVGARLGVPDKAGVVLADVFEKTPAAKAGLKSGDILTSIGGTTVKDGKALQNVVAGLPVNKEVPVQIYRDGQAMTLNVTIEEQPSEYGTATAPAPRVTNSSSKSVTLEGLGVDVAELTDETADGLGFRKGVQGVVITRVHEDGVAAESGLRRGMVITRINNQAVATTAAATQAVQAGNLAKGVLLQVTTPQGGVNYVLLRNVR